MSDDQELVQRIAKLEGLYVGVDERIASLEAGRPGRRKRPMLVSADHVCGIDPERDSSTCPDASMYRRNQGCKGDACLARSSTYYQERQQRTASKENT